MSDNSFGTTVYNDLDKLGKFQASIFSVLFITISIGLIILGIYLLMKKNKYTESLVVQVNYNICEELTDTSKPVYNCSANFSYKVKDVEYPGKDIRKFSNNTLPKNADLKLFYDPTNPGDYTVVKIDYKKMGLISIGVAIILLLLSLFYLYMVRNFKIYSAGSGAAGIFSLFR